MIDSPGGSPFCCSTPLISSHSTTRNGTLNINTLFPPSVKSLQWPLTNVIVQFANALVTFDHNSWWQWMGWVFFSSKGSDFGFNKNTSLAIQTCTLFNATLKHDAFQDTLCECAIKQIFCHLVCELVRKYHQVITHHPKSNATLIPEQWCSPSKKQCHSDSRTMMLTIQKAMPLWFQNNDAHHPKSNATLIPEQWCSSSKKQCHSDSRTMMLIIQKAMPLWFQNNDAHHPKSNATLIPEQWCSSSKKQCHSDSRTMMLIIQKAMPPWFKHHTYYGYDGTCTRVLNTRIIVL